ncbi:nucleoside diphosphate kinase homolog 7 isoform X1 [Dermacentor andersoni]|uniref:nucleoside diphosphate kinase homolog 7 isoform X1 n=1 Tax=Dermacentor andersoni TaxID=34620 RepID=UPI003B3BDA61
MNSSSSSVRVAKRMSVLSPSLSCLPLSLPLCFFLVSRLQIEVKTRRVFLRRTECEDCSLRDLYAGNVVAVLSRHLRILGYADAQTAAFLGPKHERAVLVLRPAGVKRLGDVWAAVEAAGATVCKALMLRLTPQDVKLLSGNQQEVFDEGLLSDPAVCIQVLGERVLARLRNQLVKTEGRDSGQQAVTLQSLCWISKDKPSAEKESLVLFGSQFDRRCNTAVFENTTCCVVKPHVFKDGNVSSVLGKILTSGFEITALQMFHLDCAKAEEFLLVYKGVAPNYTTMVQQLCSGPCLAMEVRSSSDSQNSALHLKELVGPADPALARRLYPDSLRADVGRDLHKNGVHCTDVPEDSGIEVEFFFHAGKS